VIGGSSAGATIQGDYLVRGSPFGPQAMMCEGYERGLCFLPGVAIDQHFTARNRFADMTSLTKKYPQFLVSASTNQPPHRARPHCRDHGQGKVHFYDRRKPIEPDGPTTKSPPPEIRYDFKERTVIPRESAGEACGTPT